MSRFGKQRLSSLESISTVTSVLSSNDENEPSVSTSGGDRIGKWIEGELEDGPHERERIHAETFSMHEHFCSPAENIYFLIDGVLYVMDRYFFDRDSSSFFGQGLTQQEPMVLADITTRNFDLFLSILYPRMFGAYGASTIEEWSSILHLADKWNFESIRSLSIAQLVPISSPIDKIVIGKQYGFDDWLPNAYQMVCTRLDALTLEEGRRLGVDDVIRIHTIRQQLIYHGQSCLNPPSLHELIQTFGLNVATTYSASTSTPFPQSTAPGSSGADIWDDFKTMKKNMEEQVLSPIESNKAQDEVREQKDAPAAMGSSSSKAAGISAATSAAEAKIRAEILDLIACYMTKVPSGRAFINGSQDADLRDEFETMKKNMEEQVLSLTGERDKAQEEVRKQKDVLAAVQLDRDELSTQVAGMGEQGRIMKFGMEQLNQQLDRQLQQANTLKAQLDRRETEMRTLSDELAQIKTQHTQTVTLLDARTTELKGAQVFLTKSGSMSGADVVRMIEGLDAEILQTSAFVAYRFEFQYPKSYDMNDELQGASTRLAEVIGPQMVDFLATTEHAQEPLVIRLACQAATAAFCRWVMMSWDIEDENINHFLQEAYLTIQNAEEQSVAGRWRSITRTQVQSMIHGDADVSSLLVPHLANYFVEILLVAGVPASEEAIHEIVMRDFADKMTKIVRLALALNQATGREITSADLEPYIILWDTVFDPTAMEDLYKEPAHWKPKALEDIIKEEDHVLCTTDLGLRRIVKLPKNKDGTGGDIQTTVLLKPKVVLHSAIQGFKGAQVR
ncbi:hypothetical protein HWV62_26799 [Athelia sp. TMB]|nr:hypothetical protein HWV62_26799 [Athelia sp. TMB]